MSWPCRGGLRFEEKMVEISMIKTLPTWWLISSKMAKIPSSSFEIISAGNPRSSFSLFLCSPSSLVGSVEVGDFNELEAEVNVALSFWFERRPFESNWLRSIVDLRRRVDEVGGELLAQVVSDENEEHDLSNRVLSDVEGFNTAMMKRPED